MLLQHHISYCLLLQKRTAVHSRGSAEVHFYHISHSMWNSLEAKAIALRRQWQQLNQWMPQTIFLCSCEFQRSRQSLQICGGKRELEKVDLISFRHLQSLKFKWWWWNSLCKKIRIYFTQGLVKQRSAIDQTSFFNLKRWAIISTLLVHKLMKYYFGNNSKFLSVWPRGKATFKQSPPSWKNSLCSKT